MSTKKSKKSCFRCDCKKKVQQSSNTNNVQQEIYNRSKRRSSIPYSGREPKVRFHNRVELILIDEYGGYANVPKPAAPDDKNEEKTETIDTIEPSPPLSYDTNLKPKKSILMKSKSKTKNPVHSPGSTDSVQQTINEGLEELELTLETITQLFSKAERQARDAVDLLTFPVLATCVEPLSRFEGSIIISILSVQKISYANDKSPVDCNKQGNPMTKVVKLLGELLICTKNAKESASKLVKASLERYKDWFFLLIRRSYFRVEHRLVNVKAPIYTKKSMPEKATMFEDFIDEDKRYCFDGVMKIYRNGRNIILLTDVQKEELVKYPDEIDQEQLLVVAESVIEHAKDLMMCVLTSIGKSMTTLADPEFNAGLKMAQNRILELQVDKSIDLFWVMELKQSFLEIVHRKGELLNTSEHTEDYLISIEKSIKKVQKYCNQVATEIETRIKTQPKCCGLIKPVTPEDCLKEMISLGEKDFVISVPLTYDVEREVFKLEPKPTESRISRE